MEELPQLNKVEILLSKLEAYKLFTDQDKVNLILVLEGAKSICEIELNNPSKEAYEKNADVVYQENTEEFEKSISVLEALIQELGLFYDKMAFHNNESQPEYDGVEFIVSKVQEKVDLFRKIEEEKNDEKRGIEFGKIFEIPDTAIKAFESGKLKLPEDLPSEIKQEEAFYFIYFAFSEDYWQEEFEIVRRRAEIVKEIAPNLYAKIVSGQ
ncbi:MAG: hypothetical protein EXS49_02190 [Candidatus Pacebacteria bacterium]|nr:hypothetical protein [Candidatus Paceibacterota bacterium]